MNHPELIYLAAEKYHIPIPRLIYDAYCYNEFMVSRRRIYNIYNLLINEKGDLIPQLVEDYALVLLAENEHQVGQLFLV